MRLALRPRVRAAWAILRMRHPLLASHVVMQNYDDIKFVYVFLLASADQLTHPLSSHSFRPPTSPEDALARADSELDYRHQDKDSMCGGPGTWRFAAEVRSHRSYRLLP